MLCELLLAVSIYKYFEKCNTLTSYLVCMNRCEHVCMHACMHVHIQSKIIIHSILSFYPLIVSMQFALHNLAVYIQDACISCTDNFLKQH